MGFFSSIAGFQKVTQCDVIFGTGSEKWSVTVREQMSVAGVQAPDYVRLWSRYFTQTLYNYGGFQTQHGTTMYKFLEVLSKERFAEREMIILSVCGGVYEYKNALSTVGDVFSATYLARKSFDRIVEVKLPGVVDPFRPAVSTLALLQYAVGRIGSDSPTRVVLDSVIRAMFSGFQVVTPSQLREFMAIPDAAYLHAIGGA